MILGITGGVGSGKSTILNYLESKYNAFIIEADKVAKYIMEPGYPVYDKVVRTFKEIKLDEKGYIDRAQLAQIVFNDSGKLKKLNSIVHPGVKKEILSLISVVKDKTPDRIVVIEAALLVEDGYKDICDEIWYVYCDDEERIKRLEVSRGYTRKKALGIMSNQLSEDEFRFNTDEIINNTLSKEETEHQIDILFRKKAIRDVL